MSLESVLSVDRFYQEMGGSLEDKVAAGLVDSPVEEYLKMEEETRRFVTPLGKASMRIGPRPVVLYITGGFDPLHEGHLSALEEAKAYMEAAGRTVLCAFIAPDHDDYVVRHKGGRTAFERVEESRYVTEEYDWIDVDPYPAYSAPSWMNFTFLLDRISRYVERHLGVRAEVVYVHGSDNADHVKPLSTPYAQSRGISALEVGRYLKASPAGLTSRHHLSSTRVRRGEHPLHERISEFRARNLVGEGLPYVIRDDLALAAPWLTPGERRERLDALVQMVRARTPEGTQVRVRRVEEQLRSFARPVLPTISLDPWFQGTYNVGVSRVFIAASGQYRPLGVVPRGSHRLGKDMEAALKEAFAHIPSGDYVLVDDDISSGATVRAVKGSLPAGVRIVAVRTLWAENFYDVIDARDFVEGSLEGGLVCVRVDGALTRNSYLRPEVNLAARARLSANNAPHSCPR